MDTIRVQLNGKERDLRSGLTVRALLESLEILPGMVVVERNREILSRARYDEVEVREGDRLELVHFVGAEPETRERSVAMSKTKSRDAEAPPEAVPEGAASGVTVAGGGVVRADPPVEPRRHAKGEISHESTRIRLRGDASSSIDTDLETPPQSLADVEGAPLVIGGKEFRSRLILGTGKYRSPEVMMEALRASGTEMVTVAVRRVDLDRKEGILNYIDPDEFFLLANTAGCYTADEAVRYARLARAAGFNEWLKLEVIGDADTLLPDTTATIEAAKVLVAEGFKVMAYTNDDLITALRLEDAGCISVMPLASPIGSGLGVVNPYFIREIKRRLTVPVIVDAGVGTASDACITMEQGVDGILMNTALAAADEPVAMARAMRYAVRAGRLAFLAGRMPAREIAVPSSPLRGMLD